MKRGMMNSLGHLLLRRTGSTRSTGPHDSRLPGHRMDTALGKTCATREVASNILMALD